jgi:hypothetical protein
MDQSRDATDARPTLPYWAAPSLVAATGAITPWFTSDSDHGDYHMVGPYQVPLTIEYIVGGVAVALGLAALRASTRSTRSWGAVTRPTIAVLVLTAMTTAGLWRVMTNGVIGVNIGGGMAVLAGPALIAGGLFLALCVQCYGGGMRTGTFVGLSVLTLSAAPILFAIVWFGLDP